MKQRQINSTLYPIALLFISNNDHITGATGVVPWFNISKNNGAFAGATGAITEIGKGWYSWTANSTDRNTLGELLITASGINMDQLDEKFEIVSHDPFSPA